MAPKIGRKTSNVTDVAVIAPAEVQPALRYTVPGMSVSQGGMVAAALQQRLNALNDLALTLKHVHWNVVGPHFIAVHEMLDPQVDAVRGFADDVAERIATLGSAPVGTPGALVAARTWDDYAVGRAGAIEHLGALDVVYQGVITEHRQVARDVEDVDPVTHDLLISQLGSLEKFHWFIRAHLENAGGELSTAGATTELGAAEDAGAGAAQDEQEKPAGKSSARSRKKG